MAQPAVNPRGVRFGPFELDLEARELRRSGIRIKLQDQPFQILAMLLERPGEVVTREDLQKRLWPEDTFVDFDLSLNSAVKKLRQALGDDSDNPRFVETLYRRGYRFVAAVHEIGRAAVPPAEPLLAPPLRSGPVPIRNLRSRLPLYATASLLLMIVAVGMLRFARPQPPRVLGYTQITHDGRLKGQFVTDGERLYIQELDGDHYVVVQVSASGGETAILPTPFSNIGIDDISPDGSALLILDFKGDRGSSSLWSLPLPAGSSRRLSDLPPGAAAWSPDGNELAFTSGADIYFAKNDGSGARRLVSLPGQPSSLRFSPDGRHLRFGLYDSRRGADELWEMKRDGSDSHPLLPGWSDAPQECCGNWTRDGKYYVFENFRQGASNLWALPERSGWFGGRAEPVQLTNGPLAFGFPVPSKDGKRIYSFGTQPRSELLRYDPKAGLVPYFKSMSAIDLAFSPDGQWVAYVSIPEQTLWRSRIDGREPLQLTSSSMYTALPRWSPDGQRLVFMGRTDKTNYRSYLVSSNAGDLQELIPGAEIGFDPGWSADGKSIVMSLGEADAPGEAGISVLDLASKKLSQLPGSENLFSPRSSPDGKYIAAITKDSQKLMLFDLSTRKWSELASVPAIGFPTWSHDGQYLYFDTTFNDDPGFFRVRASDHKLEKLFSLKGLRRFRAEFGSWTGLAPDDSPLLSRDISSQEIYALDWQAP